MYLSLVLLDLLIHRISPRSRLAIGLGFETLNIFTLILIGRTSSLWSRVSRPVHKISEVQNLVLIMGSFESQRGLFCCRYVG